MTDTRKHQAPDDAYDLLGEDEDQPITEVPPVELIAIHTIPGVPMDREGLAEGETEEPAASWFEDEEPEGDGVEDAWRDEETPDVEDLLIAQHYAFGEEPEEEFEEELDEQRDLADEDA